MTKNKYKIFVFLLYMFSLIICACNEQPLSKIVKGDYSSIHDKNVVESLKTTFERLQDKVEWIYWDANGDGQQDLILQENYENSEGMRKIIGIFTVENQKVICKNWDDTDVTEYSSMCHEKLVYYQQYLGIYNNYCYYFYSYDEEWNEILICGLEIYEIEDSEALPPNWSEKYPEMVEEGTYYRKLIINKENGEKQYSMLTKAQWMEEFQKF